MIASVIKSGVLLAGISGLAVASGVPQEQLGWGRAQQLLQGQTPQSSAMAIAVSEWNALRQSNSYPFDRYARFLIAHPGWPGENALRRTAERSMDAGNWSPSTAVSYFRRHAPLTGGGKTRYAEALSLTGQRDEAQVAARNAWVSGPLSVTDEAKLISGFPGALRSEDHDARMDELLWQGSTASAQRQIALASPGKRALFEARLAFRTNAADAADRSAATQGIGANDPGYIADRATWLRNNAAAPSARSWLARPRSLARRPGDVEKWFEVLLANAREAANDGQSQTAFDIASKVDDAFPEGTDISRTPLGERDDYTSLVWLAGQTALKKLNRPADAIGMYDRYARGSQTPQSQSKGYYWAGRAAQAAGRTADANAFFTRAAGYRDLFYGQLALERLALPLTPPGNPVPRPIDEPVRAAYFARETVRAAQYLGTVGRWEDQTAFVRQIAIDAKSDSDHMLATELSRMLGRPDLGVMVGRSALQNGFTDYTTVAFPNVRVPDTQASNWTIIHAIARQESQFDRAAISHAGARGLMQLMPGTARETAGKLGLTYQPGSLTTDTDYNIQLGASYFQRVYNNYNSYPLAVAAYNAGPGNVNKWLRANGDPRMGAVDMVDWIEAIPIQETRNYVQRVLENAVVYDLMNPARARSSGANRISWYLGKQQPG
ncbi:transglycosylase SLT domain-containing protein [Sphingomonas sp. UYAg733]